MRERITEETDGRGEDQDSDSGSEMDEDEKVRKKASRLKGPSRDAIAKFEDYREYLFLFLCQS